MVGATPAADGVVLLGVMLMLGTANVRFEGVSDPRTTGTPVIEPVAATRGLSVSPLSESIAAMR